MANEISVTAQISVFKPSTMSTAIARALNSVLFSMAGNLPIESVAQIGPAVSGTIIGATNANPIVIQTSSAHGLTGSQITTVSGVGGNTNANGTWAIGIIDTTHFSIPATGNGAYTSGGTFTGGVTPIPGPSSPHWAWFFNSDPTNYVQIFPATTGAAFLRLQAGEFALGPLEPANAYYGLANTAAVNLEYLIAGL